MKRKTKKRTAIASLILAGALLVPTTQAHALGCSVRASVCRPSVSVCRPSVSRPSVSISRSATVRSSVSSRPSSIKSGTSTFRVARGGHVGHASHASHASHSSRTTTHSSKTTVKSSRATKVDSGKFSTKPSATKSTPKTTIKSSNSKATNKTTIKSKRTTINVTKHYTVRPHRSIAIVNTHPTFYTHYSARPVVYNSGLSFWDYYMLTNLMESKKQVTERDIARELESRGYSNSEVNTILKQANSEQQIVVKEEQSFGHKVWNFIKGLIKWTLIIAGVGLLVLGIAIMVI